MENQGQIFQSKQKAIDYALWLMFEKRRNNFRYQVLRKGDYFYVLPITATIKSCFEKVPLYSSYAEMNFEHIEAIGQDTDGLPHWDKVRGMVSVVDGETLRFIIALNVPIEKFIRAELANRGYDKDHLWCGFDEAKREWLES